MVKKLADMSLEELWQLFPIVLVRNQPCWPSWYTEESGALARILAGSSVRRISHIGSTAVAGIWAKPIVDILVEVDCGCAMVSVRDVLKAHGYLCMSEETGRMSFNKGYTENGFAERVFHLHVRNYGDNDELYFRDYLNDHSEAAREYEALKLRLWKEYEHDRDGYTDAKGDFVAGYTRIARLEYADRYGEKTDVAGEVEIGSRIEVILHQPGRK